MFAQSHSSSSFAEKQELLSSSRLFARALIDLNPSEDLKNQLQKLTSSSSDWQRILTEKNIDRPVPPYSKKDILDINTIFSSERDAQNVEIRKQLSIVKDELSCAHREMSSLQNEMSKIVQGRPVADLLEGEVAFLNSLKASWELTKNRLLGLQAKRSGLSEIPNSKRSSDWVCHIVNEKTLGWVPDSNSYVQIEAVEPPTSDKQSQCYSLEVHSKTANLQLTLYNMLELASSMMLGDEMVKTMILKFLEQHKRDLFVVASMLPTFTLIYEHLLLSVNNSSDLMKVSRLLASFSRPVGESILTTLSRFSSLQNHLHLLYRPDMSIISQLSLKALLDVIPFLLSEEGSIQFTRWRTNLTTRGLGITETAVLTFVAELERDSSLIPTSHRNLPSHLGYSVLSDSYDASGSSSQASTVESSVLYTSNQERQKQPRDKRGDGKNGGKPSGGKGKDFRGRSGNRQKAPTEARNSSKGSRSSSTSSQSSGGGKDYFKPKINPDRRFSRSRSGSLSAASSRSRSSSWDEKVPRVFDTTRKQSDKNKKFLAKYFSHLLTEKYMDWKTRGFCSRCYSPKHVARNCDKFEFTSEPCKWCALFHDSSKCPVRRAYNKAKN